jgi:hypothetical protein
MTAAQRSMPSWSLKATWAATWSRIVMKGKLEPHSDPSGECDAGPVASPPARGRMACLGRAHNVTVAGESVQHEHRVVAIGVELAPRLEGDSH